MRRSSMGRMGARSLVVAIVAGFTPLAGEGQEWEVVATDSIRADRSTEEIPTQVIPMEFPPQIQGLTQSVSFRLEIMDPELADLDLNIRYVGGPTICSSAGTGRFENCVVSAGITDPIEAVVSLFNNAGSSDWVLSRRAVVGPLVFGILSEDAIIIVPDSVYRLSFLPGTTSEDGRTARLLRLPPGVDDSWVVSIGSEEPEDVIVAFADNDGELIPPLLGLEVGSVNRTIQGGETAYLAIEPPYLDLTADSLVVTVSVTATTDARPLTLDQRGSATVDSTGYAHFTIRLMPARSTIIRLAGRGFSLRVGRSEASTNEFSPIPVTSVTDGASQIAYIGDRVDGSSPIIGGLSDRTDVDILIDVDPETEDWARTGRWALVIDQNDGGIQSLLVPDFPSVIEFAEDMGGEAPERGSVALGGIHVFRLAPPHLESRRSALMTELPEYSATLLQGAEGLDLAVVNSLGRVLDFSRGSVAWDWPDSGQSLYVILISNGTGTGNFQLQLRGYRTSG